MDSFLQSQRGRCATLLPIRIGRLSVDSVVAHILFACKVVVFEPTCVAYICINQTKNDFRDRRPPGRNVAPV